MPPSDRQRKLERKTAKRKKQKAQQRSYPAVLGRKAQLRQAATWPVMECWVNRDWRDPMQLNQVVVARRDPSTRTVVAAAFLVDRACLGVKNAAVARFATVWEYRDRFLSDFGKHQEMIPVDLNSAAAIVKAGLDYAASLKFRPHRDFVLAAILLGDADPTMVSETIPVGGPEGKPYFIAGPNDDPDRILAHLTQLCGPEGFHFSAPIDPLTGGWLSHDDDGWLDIDEGDDGGYQGGELHESDDF